MKKKLISMLLCVTMTVTLALAGCGSKSADSEKDDKEDLPKFRIGAIPDQDTAELQKGNDAVAAYLSADKKYCFRLHTTDSETS